MANIVWTDYLERQQKAEVAPPVQWRRELNMPNPKMFVGEWLPAQMQREAEQARREKHETFEKWVYFLKWLGTGLVFIIGSLAGYLAMLSLVGTP